MNQHHLYERIANNTYRHYREHIADIKRWLKDPILHIIELVMRIRITFVKQGALRYTGHLDLHKLWERAARRAELPLAYSQGFHPQPKMNMAAALPLGFSSRCEVHGYETRA